MSLDKQEINQLKQWPYRECRGLMKSLKKREPKSGKVLFETGYGPSGLPHIGTFAEVARTTWVRQAYTLMTGEQTLLYAFSDDMDGLRKVPNNIPNRELIAEHLGKPLCDIPDPFGERESYSGYMNAKLREFLDHFGFDYTFKASHEQYRGGVFNEGLGRILDNYEKIRGVILPTLSEENRADWSPFMPICRSCGKVNSTRVVATHPERGTLSYVCDGSLVHEKTGWGYSGCGDESEIPVTDGNVKVGWKVDWALRWYTFGVNYEMYGKDLIDSAKLSSKICRILGEQPPVGMFYEMFLDQEGHKISKSIGNGLTIDEWLTYGPLESLALFIYKRPDRASRLHFDVIPQHIDEYLNHLSRWPDLDRIKRCNSPVYFIHHAQAQDDPEQLGFSTDLNFNVILNLVSVLNSEDREMIWTYLLRYRPDAEQDRELIDGLIDKALVYYRDFVLPTKDYQLPSDEMRPAVDALVVWLDGYDGDDAVEIQNAAYAAGKDAGVNLREFFKTMYQLLIGQDQGPRLGTFIQLYGVKDTLKLAQAKLVELSG
ncbi:MAG: lysine--tRNA ligase [Myxococcales bacterium]|nr:lysine--tRNA ligase [Myxococcales bacterium]